MNYKNIWIADIMCNGNAYNNFLVIMNCETYELLKMEKLTKLTPAIITSIFEETLNVYGIPSGIYFDNSILFNNKKVQKIFTSHGIQIYTTNRSILGIRSKMVIKVMRHLKENRIE